MSRDVIADADVDVGDLAIPLLSQLIAVSTVNPPGNELNLARFLAQMLSGHGVQSEIDEFEPGRANLVATVEGQGLRPPIVLSAHMDTLPIGKEVWKEGPFSGTVREGKVFGRGAADMKGAIASMIEVLLGLARGHPPKGDVILALSAGENTNCDGAKRLVKRADIARAGALLVGEPTSLDVVVAEMGALWLRVVSRGRTGHSSGDGGLNAINQLMRFLDTISGLPLPCPGHDLLPRSSLLVGTIRGGEAVNLTPDHCEAEVDVRLRPGTDPSEVIALFNRHAPDAIDVETIDFKPPVETQADHSLVKASLAACRAIRGEGEIGGVSYYSDATVFASERPLPFVVIGPGLLGMSGQSDEYVEVKALRDACRIYRSIIGEWAP